MEKVSGYDFVIVGSGGGGVIAAITAKKNGLNPLVLEKTDRVGGSSALSGGIVWLPNNPVMRREGEVDSTEEALTYIRNFTQGVEDITSPARQRAFVEKGPELVTFLENLGMKFEYCREYADYYAHLPGGHDTGRSLQAALFNLKELGDWKDRFRLNPAAVPLRTSEGRHVFLMKRTAKGAETAAKMASRVAREKVTRTRIVGSGGALMGRLIRIALDLGVEFWTEAPMNALVQSDGRVTGVRTTRNGVEVEVDAPHGVLVAAGGFARNLEMRRKYLPKGQSVDWTKANPGDTGEAIEMMQDAGAGLGMMGEAWWIPSSIPPGSEPIHNVADLSKPYGILVDANGERFANESGSYMEIGKAMWERNKTASTLPAWYVMDARHRKYYPWFRTPPGVTPQEWVQSGWMKQAETIEGLAVECGVDPAGLAATVRRFNRFAAIGRDEDFGRGSNAYATYFADPKVKPNGSLGPIEQGPFQAIPIWPGDGGTAGGVLADEHGRVLRDDRTPIDGLFATGNCTAPGHGAILYRCGVLDRGILRLWLYLGARGDRRG